ncbi:3-deoxy-manno-octulosonate cytidylyltransferase [Silvanigrella aquatica]|uniref:3-deoxy-D-manno-octulosonate cytidylyltransferase n=1 Tax=Silvanigrella aquatica TaxID=1915309 RepID=A0A1L4D2Z9_9BACT|nr:3-deoxy-manno-octulosonate cytidylyltransferase [Silvanigrella aquatica]APJ04576.1 3-deoxy-D-manno-octulosonate cytidylyltransferase [Silvanigrella aquatica]
MHICIIPARMGSSRFPNKPLAPILGIPMLGHVALRCKLEPLFDLVAVATCDQEIFEYCASIGVKAVMTSNRHERASDRIQEALIFLEKKLTEKVTSVTMVQGDEPMVTPSMLKTALSALYSSKSNIVNLCSEIETIEEFCSPNCVKVVLDKNQYALYFSREAVPSISKFKGKIKPLKQVCIIPFQRNFLIEYSNLPPTPLEEIESIDMLRVLEHGMNIYCEIINEKSWPVDVPEDIIRVEKALSTCPLLSRYIK